MREAWITDAVVGIAVAFIALAVAPSIMRAWDRLVEKGTLSVRTVKAESDNK